MMKQLLSKVCTIACVMMLSATVVSADEPTKVDTKSKAATTQKTRKSTDASKKQKKTDINSATAEEIAAINGLDKATAAKIVENRPYANKTQLVKKQIISDVLYEQIKDSIIAKKIKDNGTGEAKNRKK